MCRKNRNSAGVVYWSRVTAFLIHLANEGNDTIH